MDSKVATLNIFLESYYYYLKTARPLSILILYLIKNTYVSDVKVNSWRLTQYYINRAVPNVPSNPRFVAENDLCYTTLDLEALNHLRSTPFSTSTKRQRGPIVLFLPFWVHCIEHLSDLLSNQFRGKNKLMFSSRHVIYLNCVYVKDIDESNSIEKGKQPPKLLLVTLILLVYQDHDIMYVSNTFYSW